MSVIDLTGDTIDLTVLFLAFFVGCEILSTTSAFVPSTAPFQKQRHIHIVSAIFAEDSQQQQDTMPSSTSSQSAFQVLGVCGGIGAGKSTACKLLVSECNCLSHIDADSLAHSVYSPGSQAVQDVVAEFGSNILTAKDATPDKMEIDRKQLGAIVFADRAAMAKLEAIVWPHVKTLIVEQIDKLRKDWEATASSGDNNNDKRPIVILEAAVLLDAGWDDLLDGVWIVTAPKEVALQRLMETRGLSQEEAAKRIKAQESRRGMGLFQQEIDNGMITGVIENKGGLEELTASLKSALDNRKFWK